MSAQEIGFYQQPQDQLVRPGGVAVFEASTDGGPFTTAQWYYLDGRDDRFQIPLGPPRTGPAPIRLVVDDPGEETLFVNATENGASAASAYVSLRVEPGFARARDQGAQPDGESAFSGTLLWQDFVPTSHFLDHVRLPLSVAGGGAMDARARVSLRNAADAEIGSYTLRQSEVGDHRYQAWDGWTPIPLRVSVTPGERYRLVVDLRGQEGEEATFSIWAAAGDAYPAGASSEPGYDLGFYTFGPMDRVVDPARLRMGAAALERYDSIAGESVEALTAAPRFGRAPDSTEAIDRLEFAGEGLHFGVRTWAWLVPEVSGAYRFWIAADDQGELWLSPGDDPLAAQVIARVPDSTAPGEFEKFLPEQLSATTYLEAGHAYYVEARMKQGGDQAHLSVAWEGPGIERQIVPGEVLGLAPPAIAVEPEDQSVRPGGLAVFEVRDGGSPGVRYQWYEGRSGDTSRPLPGASASRLVIADRYENTPFWVELSNPGGQSSSQAAELHIDPARGFAPRPDQRVDAGSHTFENLEVWQEFAPESDYTDHLRLPLYAVGSPQGTILVELSSFVEPLGYFMQIDRFELSLADLSQDGWTILPLPPVNRGGLYRLYLDLRTDPSDDGVFGLYATSGDPYPSGDSSLGGYDIAFASYGTSRDWWVQLGSEETSISDYRQAASFSVEANTDWSVRGGADWLSVEAVPDEEFAGRVELAAAPYTEAEGFFGPRSTRLIVGDQAHLVTQEAIDPVVTVDAASGSIAEAGGTYILSLTSNFQWQVRLEDLDWIELAGSPTRDGDVELHFTIAPNPTSEPRSATIQIFDQVHVLTQAGVEEQEDEGAAPAEAVVRIDASTAVYDGSPQAPQVSTEPAGLAYSIRYPGFDDEPADAGSYPFVANITDPDYAGSAEGVLEIAKAEVSVRFSQLVVVEDGTEQLPVVAVDHPGLAHSLSVEGGVLPREPGVYRVTATIEDRNHQGSGVANFYILPESTPIETSRAGRDLLAIEARVHAGLSYVLEQSNDLVEWEVVGQPVSASGDSLRFELPIGEGGNSMFFRVRATADADSE